MRAFAAALLALAVSGASAQVPVSAPAATGVLNDRMSGDIVPVHDPVIIREGEPAEVLDAALLTGLYGVECDIDRLKYTIARWVKWNDDAKTTELKLPTLGVLQAVDRDDRQVLLFESNWELQYCERENPSATFLAVA